MSAAWCRTLRPRPLASPGLGVTRIGRPSRVFTTTGDPSITVWKKRARPMPSTRFSGMSWNGIVASCGGWHPALARAPAAATAPLTRRNSRRSIPVASGRALVSFGFIVISPRLASLAQAGLVDALRASLTGGT